MNTAPAALATASACMAALASTLMPTGRPVARRTRSVITAITAAVSGPMASGLRNGMSPWFSTIRPSKPGRRIGLGIRYRAGVDRLHRLPVMLGRARQRQSMHDADDDAAPPPEQRLERVVTLADDRQADHGRYQTPRC